MRLHIASLALVLVAAGCGGGTAPGGNDMAGNGSGDMAGGGTCKDDTTCKAPTGHCDTKTGKCVGCLDDTTCPEGQVCTGGACVPGCNAMKSCGDAGVCDVQSGTCKSCMSDNECTDKNNPRCDVPNMKCVPCLPANDNCAQGTKCVQTNGNYMCAKGCKGDAECMANGGPSSVCCNGTCTDKNTDGVNCGACGKSCNGQTCCAGGCIDTTKDPANCGGCGTACNVANGVAGCANSKCTVASCNMGFADCDQLVPNGCEIDTNGDKDNCLGCGNTCTVANGVAGCSNGCVITSCNQGFGDCDNMYQNGCEADTASNPSHCGGCGMACSANNIGNLACSGGQCTGLCNGGFGDCDNDKRSNGCETNTLSNVANCGGCGMACSNANIANPTCGGGQCTGACNAGFGDCDVDKRSNGCEVSLLTNVANCGGCGMACSNGNIANPTCGNGACTGACNAGFGDCDNNKRANGCEKSLTMDAANCGACGAACSGNNIANPTCGNGVCNGACNAGFGDCDNNKLSNGCEVDTQTNAANCGGCGMACSNANIANPTCGGGQCTGACNAGFGDCDNNKRANGCEVNTQTNAAHCGGCGMGCSNNHIAAPTCAAGVCNGACDVNFSDCDNNKRANGCEVMGGCGGNSCLNKNVLILGENQPADTALVNSLNAAGMVATLVAGGSNNYAGNPPASNYGAVIVLTGTTYNADMPLAGQTSVVNAANVSTGVIFTEWAAFQITSGRYLTLAPLLLIQRANGFTGNHTYTSLNVNHPIWSGLPASFLTTQSGAANVGGVLTNGGMMLATCAECMNGGVAIRDNGKGRIVQVAHAASYMNLNWMNDANLSKMMVNSAKWAARCDLMPFANFGGINWYKVQVNGAMTDNNIRAACLAAGLNAPCQMNGACQYNDGLCKISTPEMSCGNPMIGLSMSLCGGQNPRMCPALDNVFTYMGNMWFGGCGALGGQWCVQGNTSNNGFALCIQ